MPRQNRPVVRDGRLQAPKKRTDRSYLGNAAPPVAPAPSEAAADEPAPAHDPVAAFQPPAPPPAAAPAAPSALPVSPSQAAEHAAARRRRREVDPEALLAQDSSYAMHELRRIAILAVMVVATLIALGVFMR